MPSLQQQIISPDSYNYLLFLPNGSDVYDALRLRNEIQQLLLPTILFLHGAGERGSYLNHVKKIGIAKVVEEQPDFPFIVISPQCPGGEYWNVERLSTLVDEVITSYPVDPDRVYLTGLSMGGYGTWHLAAAQPERFAAIAPICGGGNPTEAGKLKNLPVWAFHGAKDNVVPLSESEIMVSALKAHDGNVKFTVYAQAEHDSWTQTYKVISGIEGFVATCWELSNKPVNHCVTCSTCMSSGGLVTAVARVAWANVNAENMAVRIYTLTKFIN